MYVNWIREKENIFCYFNSMNCLESVVTIL